MTLIEFCGCTLISFGPPVIMFILTVATNPLRVIVLMASAFCWLISLLMTSIIWFAVVPLRGYLVFTLFPSVIFQEAMRIAFFKLLKKAELGLQKMAIADIDPTQVSVTPSFLDPLVLSYVSGLGFGLMAGAFSMINMLSDMIGPGTIGLRGQSQDFFFLAALQTLFMILLNTFWGIIIFAALNGKQYGQLAGAVLCHFLVSGLTLLNQVNTWWLPTLTTIIACIVLIGCMIWALFVIRKSHRPVSMQLLPPAEINAHDS